MNAIPRGRTHSRSRLPMWIAAIAAAIVALPALARPVNAVITVPIGGTAPKGLSAKLQAGVRSGKITDLVWINGEKGEEAGFASLITIEFPSEDFYTNWVRDNSKVLGSFVPKRVEVLAKGENRPRDSSKALFKVNHYSMKVSTERYKDFALGYIAPLMEGQREAGYMTSFVMYGEQGPVGSSNAILIAEYKDQATFERVGPFKDQLRVKLVAMHPEYAMFDPIKDTLRGSVSETLGKSGLK